MDKKSHRVVEELQARRVVKMVIHRQEAAMKGFWLFFLFLCLQGIQVKALETSLVHQEKEMEAEVRSRRGPK